MFIISLLQALGAFHMTGKPYRVGARKAEGLSSVRACGLLSAHCKLPPLSTFPFHPSQNFRIEGDVREGKGTFTPSRGPWK